MSEELGFKMWGLSQNEDNRIYKEFLPFSFNKLSLGPFQGHLDHDLIFDSRVGTKDDYDMALQQLTNLRVFLDGINTIIFVITGIIKAASLAIEAKTKK
jgi:hypothetical protein